MLACLQIKHVQPMCSIDDALEAEELVLNDPIIAQLVRERYGVTDVKKQLVADPWYCGSRTRGGKISLEYKLEACKG